MSLQYSKKMQYPQSTIKRGMSILTGMYNHHHGQFQSIFITAKNLGLLFFFFFFFFTFCLFRAVPVAHGGSEAKGQIGPTATGLHHSQSNVGFKLHLRPTPQLMATPDPQPTEQSQESNSCPHGCQSDLLDSLLITPLSNHSSISCPYVFVYCGHFI